MKYHYVSLKLLIQIHITLNEIKVVGMWVFFILFFLLYLAIKLLVKGYKYSLSNFYHCAGLN